MELPDHIQIAVVGAGPAGSTLTAALARRGRDVALLERDEFPRDKVCGEFLSPESIDALRRLGCLDRFSKLAPPAMQKTRLTAPKGHDAELPLPGVARGLSRRSLDAMLFEYADDAGAACVDGADVRSITPRPGGGHRLEIRRADGEQTDELEADLVIGAWGRRTRLDRHLKRPFFDQRSPYVAFKRHHRPTDSAQLDDLEGVVELHTFDGGYCGVSFVEDNRVNVCTMFDRRLLEEGTLDRTDFWSSLGRGDTPLARRLRELEPIPNAPTCTVAQIPLRTKRPHCGDDLLHVGDAAGMIAPLAGDGQAMAIEAAMQLADMIDESLPDVSARRWQRRWQRDYGGRLQLGRLLQQALTRPTLASPAIRLADALPAIGRALVDWTRG